MGYFEELDKQVARDLGEEAAAEARLARWRSGTLWRTWQFTKVAANAARRVIFFPLISPLGYAKRFNLQGDMMVVRRAWVWRLVDFLMTRLLLAPIVLAAFMFAIVYANTHPGRVEAHTSPESIGMYYKEVRLDTLDGAHLCGWYVPALTADEVAFDPEEALLRRRPGVVVVHGLGASHEQYLPLTKRLHEAGFVVLMLDLRGQGDSDPAAVTYGLRERTDIIAGVKFLRELSMVDDSKVCVVGRDIGGVAALEAAALDSSVAAVVADGLWPRFDQRARDIFSHPLRGLPTSWMAPLYTTAFEIALRERWSNWDLNTLVRSIHRQPVLFIARTGDGYASLDSLMKLASTTGGRHDVFLADSAHAGEADQRTTDFLMDVTNWKGAKAHGVQEIQKLLENRVK
ncbi:MAG TPA: alpha/beta fold hydrolase [Phycisphaerae bacterium]|jgi:pimeloyl-ACP methyl ester carboxylesterase|nr:alpha/beta fold hydrolase [Phycisphaerae bacterium]